MVRKIFNNKNEYLNWLFTEGQDIWCEIRIDFLSENCVGISDDDSTFAGYEHYEASQESFPEEFPAILCYTKWSNGSSTIFAHCWVSKKEFK